jgi:mannose-1-phosphate guanylyltransferase
MMPDTIGAQQLYAVIMAGGGGTRLWPLSRQEHPKQSLRLLGERTMFQTAVDRLAPLFAPERILVVTSARYAEALRQQSPEVPEANFILEPAPRGTAPAIALAAMHLRRRDAAAIMACLTADHFIGNEPRFRQLLAAAAEAAQRDWLVTLGIAPTSASIGFGYIERGAALGRFGGFEAFRVERFQEKPPPAVAAQFVADGAHSWNSGMFVWRVPRIMAEFERQMPELYEALKRIDAAPHDLDAIWSSVRSTTIDYGIMEGAQSVAVIPADGLGWSDIGSWESLLEVLDGDENRNVAVGAEHLSLDTTGTLVHSARSDGRDRLVATIGVSDLVIVDTDDVLLVCPRRRSQDVKILVDRLKQRQDGPGYL